MILELQHRRPDGDVDTYHLKPGRRYLLGRGSNCEVRILDLKLSRKHAAIEFLDSSWQLIDLCSTNGCRLDGETMVGTVPLKVGQQIEIGQTTLVVQQIVSRDGSAVPSHASSGYQSDEFKPAAGSPNLLALSIRPPTPRASEQAAKYASSETFPPHPVPVPAQSVPEAVAITPVNAHPILPEVSEPSPRSPSGVRRGAPTAIRPVTVQADLYGNLDDTVATVTPVAVIAASPDVVAPRPPASASSPAQALQASAVVPTVPGEDRTYFITVLGRRVGPLSRTVARDLKTRELKGTLKSSELDQYPQA